MKEKLFEMFKRNFPFIIREDKTVLNILEDSNNKVFQCYLNNKLVGVSIVNKNTIYMLCVDKEYRNRGIGTDLLKKSEEYILNNGYDEVQVGVGDTYLMPGIPMASKALEEELEEDNIYGNVDDIANNFFIKRGYHHSWEDCNCFDMRSDLSKVEFPNYSVGDTIDGILYRWATIDDIHKIIECTDDAHQPFSKYYIDENLYNENSEKKVLIALDKDIVCGTLMVCTDEAKEKGIGSVGCTTVRHAYRGKHIGVNMVLLGNKSLKEQGIKEGFLGYTYSGLDKMYGYAGYKICVYYNMAKKSLIRSRTL